MPARFLIAGLVVSAASRFFVADAKGGAADAEGVLTEVRQLRLLTPGEAGRGLPVKLEAVITYVDSADTVFVQDEGAGTFFRELPRDPEWARGSRLLIEGESFPGLYVPGIIASGASVVGRDVALSPERAGYDDLASGRLHYQWVEAEGIGRAVETTGENTSMLRLAVDSRVLEVRVDEAAPPASSLIDARLRVRGLAAGTINDHRQMVRPYLILSDYAHVEILDPPADASTLPESRIADLLRYAPGGGAGHRVRLRGTVLGQLPGNAVALRARESAIRVESGQPDRSALRAGDRVEVLGFPRMGPFGAFLEDATIRRIGRAGPPEPRRPKMEDLLKGGFDADLVALTGRLVASDPGPEERVLVLQDRETTFRVRAPSGPAPPWAEGSLLEARGICRFVDPTVRGYSLFPGAIEIWVGEMADVRALESPPWWTARRLWGALGLLGATTAAALLGVVIQRRRIREQRAIIHGQLAREAVLEERHRIAREVHDSLEQELVGIALRLDAAASLAGDRLADLLGEARCLVARLQAELRELIWNLRGEGDGDDLPRALDRLAEFWEQTADVRLRVDLDGEPWPLGGVAGHNLVRIVQEAITNAQKHARPGLIEIRATYQPDRLLLAIRDDGLGFDDGKPGGAGHFGLIGMQERARKVGGRLRVASVPGSGTTVEVEFARPIAPRRAADAG